jgi:uncharacterized protein (DUF111 family)
MLLGSGYGFGSKTFPGISNVTRVSFFDVNKTSTTQSWQEDRVVQLNFEIDDQTPEDLSVALENIRELPGVLDVNQSLAFGKKGRMMFAVQILVVSQAESDVMAQCFEETTTLGIRKIELDRAILNRSEHIVNVGTEKFRTKRASRPGDMTTKVEIDDIAHLPGIRRRSTKADIENQTSEE